MNLACLVVMTTVAWEPQPPELPEPPAMAAPEASAVPEAAEGEGELGETDVEPPADPDADPEPGEAVAEPSVVDPPPAEPARATPDPMAHPEAPVEAADFPASDDERPPLEAESQTEDEGDAFERRGFSIEMGVGLTHCPQDFCNPIPMGGLGRLELGYRLGRIALVGAVTGGGGLSNDDETDEEAIRFFDVGAGLMVLPVKQGPVDPFFGATLGYARTARLYREDSLNDRQFTKRGAARFSGGILWHVRPRVAMGPRVDVRLPFAGEWCTRTRTDMSDQCTSIRGELLEDLDQEAEKRRQRRAFPRPWAVTLDLRITI